MKEFVTSARFTLVGTLIAIGGSAFAIWVWVAHDSMAGLAGFAALMLVLGDLKTKYGSPKGDEERRS